MSDAIDPDLVECGPATDAVRSLLRLVAATRWFEHGVLAEPTWFTAHLALMRKYAPDAFAPDVVVSHQVGGWRALERWAAKVRGRSSGFDWKFGLLKPMVRARSQERGWSPLSHARSFQGRESGPGDLFAVVGDHALWRLPVVGFDLSRAGRARQAATWYREFATGDLVEAIEWQLAGATDDLEANPFVPLLRGYAAGQYPFVLDAGRVVILRFGDPSS